MIKNISKYYITVDQKRKREGRGGRPQERNIALTQPAKGKKKHFIRGCINTNSRRLPLKAVNLSLGKQNLKPQ